MSWLNGIPVLWTLPVFAGGAALIAVLAQLVFRALVPAETLREQHDLVAALLSVVGVLYSVVLGFLVGTVWTSFDAAQQNADQEIRYAAIAYSYASALPPAVRERVRSLIAQYAVEVRDKEWAMMAQGRTDPRAAQLLDDAIQTAIAIPPPANLRPAEAVKFEAITIGVIQNLRRTAESRVLRVTGSRQRLPSVIFEALVLGALIVVGYALFFGSKRLWIQLSTTALLAACIGLFFGLIVDLNQPFGGPIRVSREAWTAVIDSQEFSGSR